MDVCATAMVIDWLEERESNIINNVHKSSRELVKINSIFMLYGYKNRKMIEKY